MIDDTPDMPPNNTLPLIKQKLNGMHYLEGSKSIRRSRIIHNKPLYVYPLGRHFDKDHTTEDLVILWYGWSPFNETIIKRKLQIQSVISYLFLWKFQSKSTKLAQPYPLLGHILDNQGTQIALQ